MVVKGKVLGTVIRKKSFPMFRKRLRPADQTWSFNTPALYKF